MIKVGSKPSMSISSPAIFMSLLDKAIIDLVQNIEVLLYKIRSGKLLRNKRPKLFVLQALDLVQN
jgi:hypothetical protein